MPEETNKLIPERRFPEFKEDGDWSSELLSDIATISKGKGIAKADLAENGLTPCIRYGELYTHYGDVITEVVSHTNVPKADLFLSKPEDVLIPASGETKIDIATASCVMLEDIALGSDLNVIRSSLYGPFFSYYLNGSKRFDIAKVAQGDTVAHLYPGQLEKIGVVFPETPEQKKIADCLSSLDGLIAAESWKLSALRDHKRGLMQQLFPQPGETVPAYRFHEFQDRPPWTKFEVGDVFQVTRGQVLAMPLVSDEQTDEMPYPVYSSRTKDQGLSGYYSDYLFEDAITWTTDGANAGDVNYRPGKFYCTNVCGVLLSEEGHANACIAALLNSVSRNHVSYVGNPKLMNGVMAKIVIPFPERDEQDRISDCLNSIDKTTNKQVGLIESLQDQRTG